MGAAFFNDLERGDYEVANDCTQFFLDIMMAVLLKLWINC